MKKIILIIFVLIASGANAGCDWSSVVSIVNNKFSSVAGYRNSIFNQYRNNFNLSFNEDSLLFENIKKDTDNQFKLADEMLNGSSEKMGLNDLEKKSLLDAKKKYKLIGSKIQSIKELTICNECKSDKENHVNRLNCLLDEFQEYEKGKRYWDNKCEGRVIGRIKGLKNHPEVLSEMTPSRKKLIKHLELYYYYVRTLFTYNEDD